MNKDDLNELVTKRDLENFGARLIADLLLKISPKKEYYTPKEFAYKVGVPYSTVIYKCKTGRLKAFQESPNSSWLICATELDRYRNQADENSNDL